MNAAPQSVTYRRIGAILVERELITPTQLTLALEEQAKTGRPLGEICVASFGLDRLSLADALAEQWEEMQAATAGDEPASRTSLESAFDSVSEQAADDELRVLLEEAQAARAELTLKTDELSTRLAALETLVAGVTDALAELSPSETSLAVGASRGRRGTSTSTKRQTAGGRSATQRAASE